GSLHAGFEHTLQCAHIAHSAANLNLQRGNRRRDLGDRSLVPRAPFKSTIKVHNVQPFRTGACPSLSHVDRSTVDRDVFFAPLPQTDSLAVENIDRGVDVHNRPKLSSRRSPTFWLFSG